MTTDTQSSPKSTLYQKAIDQILALNLFKDQDSFTVTQQIITTRFFIILFSLSVLILLVFTGTSDQVYVVLVSSPSFAIFERLSLEYPSTLVCPCSQIAIRYDEFLEFNPKYHQVCSSDFVNDEWIYSLFDSMANHSYPLDFGLVASSQFKMLSLYCQTANATVYDAIEQFLGSNIISSETLFRSAFDIRTAALVDELKTATNVDFNRTNRLVLLSIAQNLVFSSLRTNFYQRNPPGTSNYSTYTAGYANYVNKFNISSTPSNLSDVCGCFDEFNCKFPAGIFNWSNISSTYNDIFWPYPPPLFFVDGMQTGCTPQTSLLSSTLECFYNQTCIDLVKFALRISINTSPLNDITNLSNYNVTLMISDILDELMIESLQNMTNFKGYFNACAPKTCSYTYSRRFSLVYMITTLIGLIGGLSIVLRFISPYIVQFVSKTPQKKVKETTEQTNSQEQGNNVNKSSESIDSV